MALTSFMEIVANISNYSTTANNLSASMSNKFARKNDLSSGTGDDAADLFWGAEDRTIAASGNDDLDLAASLTDIFGNSLTFVKVKCILVVNKSAAAHMQIGGGSNVVPLFQNSTDLMQIPYGNGLFMFGSPKGAGALTVTAGTGDILRLTNLDGSNTATYDIAIIGTSA